MNRTAYTDQIVRQITAAGLAVKPIYRLDARIDRLYLTGREAETPFGIIEIGRTSGRVLRGWIQYGADGPQRHYGNATAVRDAVRTLRAVHASAGR